MTTMAQIKLPPGIHRQVRASGRVRYYYHPGRGTNRAHSRIRLPNDPHSPEFWRALALAKDEAVRTGPETSRRIAEMVDAYLASPRVAELKPSTQQVYIRHLMEFARELGSHEPSELKAHGIAQIRDKLRDTPGKANLIIKTIGSLYAWGREMGWVTDNPAKGVRLLKTGEHQPWSEEALSAIPTALPGNLALACQVALYTGQRVGDVRSMHRDHIEGDAIWVTQQKTGKVLLIPLHSNIRKQVLAATEFICPNPAGGQWSLGAFRGAWLRAIKQPQCKVLRDEGVVFHGLRKNATEKLVEAGCTEPEVAAMTGMSLAMVVLYSKGASQKSLAKAAMEKMEIKELSLVTTVTT